MTPVLARGNGRRYVLDADALIAFFEYRQGAADKVRHLLGEALRRDEPLLMSAVNWGEVFYIAWKRHGEAKAHKVEAQLQELPIAVIDVHRERASRAGALKSRHGLGYADAFAAELAIERSAWLVTADPEFAKVGKALSIYSLPRHEK
ncbi:MAG: type II toxin-antitoxin system VapC family toxin [Terriglobales bacterium]